jgi:hypothetical protein
LWIPIYPFGITVKYYANMLWIDFARSVLRALAALTGFASVAKRSSPARIS